MAGYTIKDTHQSTKGGGWGGTGLGGLIGVADMDLTGCSAVTNIYLDSRDNDNVRVGGLVGSWPGKYQQLLFRRKHYGGLYLHRYGYESQLL